MSDAASFLAGIAKWKGITKAAAEDAAMGIANKAFRDIVETGPQSSGDFVANTHMKLGPPSKVPDEGTVGAPFEYKRGDLPAIAEALTNPRPSRIPLGSRVSISTTVKGDAAYAWMIESGSMKFRPVNEGADHIYSKAAANIGHRFSKIGKAQLAILRSIGV